MNVTAGIAINISSNAFSDTIYQFGSTFFGSLFEYCSSSPLWIRNDGMIRVMPPEGTKFYNFAWGDHVANRKQKREAKRATHERNKCHERYIANRDRALSERNVNTREARRQQEIDLNRRIGRNDNTRNVNNEYRNFCYDANNIRLSSGTLKCDLYFFV